MNNLTLKPIAIGSLPHKDVEKAMQIVEKDFFEIPFFPQLAKVNKNEDMIFQFLEGMPSFFNSKAENFFLDGENEDFWADVEKFFIDYEDIISNPGSEKLEKYAISKNFSSSFPFFEEFIAKYKPNYAKGQIVGPFTLGVSILDQNGSCAVYDETLRDVITKLLSLKALWQIRHIKKANPDTIPIIFIDEPSVSQLGTSAYLTISNDEVISMLSEIVQIVKNNGGICAIHCCGKCDWDIPIKAGVDIVNVDAFNYAQNFGTFSSKIKRFLENGGKIAWGIVPTLDSNKLKSITLDDLVKIFEKSVNYLTKKGIDEKLIINNSLITSSCGAGALSIDLAQRAMDLVFELSKYLKVRFGV